MEKANSWHRCPGTDCLCPNHRIPPHTSSPADNFNDDPAFFHLTRTIDDPPEADERALHDMIAELETRQTELDKSMDELQALRAECLAQVASIDDKIDALEEEKEKAELSIKRRKAVFSALRRFPSEILVHIFDHAVQSTSSWGENPLCDIELVSKRWRDEVLNSPYLWSFLTIHVDKASFGTDRACQRSIFHLAKHLGRAGKCALTVAIYSVRSYHVPRDVITLLSAFAHRIHELRLSLPKSFIVDFVPLEHRFSSLTRLTIQNCDNGNAITSPLTAFNGAPLSFLELYGLPVSNDELVLSWSRLLTYQVYRHPNKYSIGTTLHHLTEVLKRAVHLRNLVARVAPNDDHSLVGRQIPTCAQLVRLALCGAAAQHTPLDRFFDLLTFPSLQILEVWIASRSNTVGYLDTTSFTAIVKAIERSRPPLTKLLYSRGRILPTDLSRLAHVTPTLSKVYLCKIEPPGLTTELLDELVAEDGEPILWPNLRELVLSGCLELAWQSIIQMVKTRVLAAIPLTSLKLTWYVRDPVVWEDVQSTLSMIKEEIQPYLSNGFVFDGQMRSLWRLSNRE